MSPDGIANLPPEKTEVVAASSQPPNGPSQTTDGPSHPPSQTTDTSSQTTNEVQSPEPAKVVEEPTPITVLAFIKAPLAKGIPMTDLRQKVGHEKEKAWTVRLNEYVDVILSLRSQHRRSNEIYASLRESYHTTLGSLVAALLKIPLQSNGSPVEGWEKLILCSNPQGPSKETTKETAKETGNGLGQTVVSGTNGLPPVVDDYAAFWAEDGPWTVDDALGHQLAICRAGLTFTRPTM